MKHKKQKKVDEAVINLNERIRPDVLEKLKQTSKALKEEEANRQEQLRLAERKRNIEKEKNKSFAELFNESNLDWKNYK